MKTNKLIATIGLTFLIIPILNTALAQSSLRHIVKEYKASLAPYEYDGYAYNKIEFDGSKTQHIEVEFSELAGQQHKLIFCTSGFEEQIRIKIYNKNKGFKKRNILYDSIVDGENIYMPFEVTEKGNYYVDYEIPASIDKKNRSGYIVMLIGLKTFTTKTQLASNK